MSRITPADFAQLNFTPNRYGLLAFLLALLLVQQATSREAGGKTFLQQNQPAENQSISHLICNSIDAGGAILESPL